MKVGILTFHKAINYGAVLQAYALKEYIKFLGCDVEVLNYAPKGIGSYFRSPSRKNIFSIVKAFIYNVFVCLPKIPFRRRQKLIFEKFVIKHLNLSTKIKIESDLAKYDVVVVGSDQVWNVVITHGVDKFYWGLVKKLKHQMFISYAASASVNMKESFYESKNECLLTNFDKISVRENELCNYLSKKIPSKTIKKVVDPTLLVGRSCFDLLVNGRSLSFNKDKKYILIYQVALKRDREICEKVQYIAKRNDYDIIEISSVFDLKKSLKKSYLNGISPEDFVLLFRNASFVVTTSFHGTVFSLLYHIPFYVFSIDKSIDARVRELLTQLNLTERIIDSPIDSLILNENIDWNEVDLLMEVMRKDSQSFIKETLLKNK